MNKPQQNSIMEFEMESGLLNILRDRLPSKIIAIYPESITNPKNDPLYVVDCRWFSDIMGGLFDKYMKLSPEEARKEADAVYGAGKIEGWKQTEKNCMLLAYNLTMRELRRDTESLFGRFKLIAGINNAVSGGHDIGGIKNLVSSINHRLGLVGRRELASEEIVELSLLDEITPQEASNARDSKAEYLSDDAVLLVLDDEIKQLYSMMGTNGELATIERFKKDMPYLEGILEGAEDFAAIRVENREKILSEAGEKFRSFRLEDYTVNALLIRLQKGLANDIGSVLTRKEAEKLGESITTLKGYYNRYTKRFSTSRQLDDIREGLHSSLGRYSFAVLKSEFDNPLFILDLANIRNLAPDELISIMAQIKTLNDIYERNRKEFYTSYLKSQQVSGSVNERIQALMVLPGMHDSGISIEDYEDAARGDVQSILPDLRDLISDPQLRIELYHIDPALKEMIENGLFNNASYPNLQKGDRMLLDAQDEMKRSYKMAEQSSVLLSNGSDSTRGKSLKESSGRVMEKAKTMKEDAESMIKGSLTDIILLSILKKSKPLQEHFQAYFASVADELSTAVTEGTAGKTPAEIFRDSLFREAESYKDTPSVKRFPALMATYKALRCLLYPDLGNSILHNLERRITGFTGINPDSVVYDAEREFFRKFQDRDNKLYESRMGKINFSLAKQIMNMMNTIYTEIQGRVKIITNQEEKPLDEYLLGIKDKDARIIAERSIRRYFELAIQRYLQSDEAMAYGIDGFFKGVSDKFGYLIRASYDARGILSESREEERKKLMAASYKKSAGKIGELTRLGNEGQQRLQLLDRVYMEVRILK